MSMLEKREDNLERSNPGRNLNENLGSTELVQLGGSLGDHTRL